ncbi:MAG: response regulator [Anaerolineae bacterium]|nr:response regulator [Anaerolineae bacterium]
MRIAYVEDNATNQALVERVARMTQHVIVPYTEGEVALDALRSEPFDMIMMDIELAGKVNGLDVVRALREAGITTPIIAVTAYAMKGDRDRCLDAGCNDYLPKPIPIKDLLDLLSRYDAKLKAAAAPLEVAAPASAPVAEAAPGPAPAPPDVPVTPPVEPVAATTPAPAPPSAPEPTPVAEAAPVSAPVAAEPPAAITP